MSTDAIVILTDDHQQIRELFRDFQGARTPQPPKGKVATRVTPKLQEMGAKEVVNDT